MDKQQKPTIWIINQFAGTPLSGWGERHFYLSQLFLKAGFRVVIISSGNNHMFNHKLNLKGLFTYDAYQGVEFLWVKTPPYNPQNASRFLAMFAFSLSLLWLPFKTKTIGKPDYLIHSSMSIFPAPIVNFLKKCLGAKKFIFEVRDLWPLTPINLMGYSKNNFVIRIIDWFETYAYRKADAIVSLLQEAEKYINFKSRDSSKFFYIPNGIDSNLIQNRLEIKREDLNIPTDHLIIGYAGTIGFANAMDSFFELIAESEDLRSKVFFVIIGDGYLKNQYQANVSSCNNVLFLPKVKKTEIGSYIDLFDVCFIAWHDSPLYNYGVSANKYFDYMAGAKPILAAQSGINDPVIKAKNGVIVKNTKKEIYYGVKQFLEMNDSKRRELGKRGFDYLLENHVYSKLGAEYIRIINK